jgi:putative ABC transport system permease protein
LALILGLYVIFHTLSMSLTERIGEVGTLHALGTTRSQVARIFMLEALALAGGGAVLGILGGIALARLLLALGITTLGTGKHIELFLVPWGAVLALATLGFGIALAGSVYPLVSLRGASAVRALRGEGAIEKHRLGFGFHLLYAFLLVLVLPAVYLLIVPVVGNLSAELTSILLGALVSWPC